MRSYRGVSPLIAAVSFAAVHRGPPIERLDHDGIHRARASVRPTNALVSRVTGRVDPSVGITYGTAPARDDHEIPLRIYRPRALRDSRTDVPVIMWFHGGGWVVGNVVDYDPICTFLAAQVGAVVVSVDYRMAPEHRAPVAAHDCVDATTWVGVNGDVLRADTSRMAVAGDSAGGNLAAVVAQVLRDHGDTRLRHQALVYPATDCTMSSPSLREHANAPILTRRSVDAFRDHYVRPGHDRRDPMVSPLFGRLEGLPARTPVAVRRQRWYRRLTSTRSGTTASGTPTRCGPRGCPPGSPTTCGFPTASPRCRERPRPWGASTAGSS